MCFHKMYGLGGSLNSESCNGKIKKQWKIAKMVWPLEFNSGAQGLAAKGLKTEMYVILSECVIYLCFVMVTNSCL